MESKPDALWNASIEELKRGYMYDEAAEEYMCLCCGERFEQGVIYPHQGMLYDAQKYAQVHIRERHTSMFHYLLSLDKKLIGLTELQKELLLHFHEGRSDKEIMKVTGAGSASTIRHHRFTLREKMKQAKLFLALMELAEGKADPQARTCTAPQRCGMNDTPSPRRRGKRLCANISRKAQKARLPNSRIWRSARSSS